MRSVQRPRCDLHVHSVHSTDSGNYALRRARLGESYTEPGRLYEICRRRGMSLVTISDHNTLEGAIRIADRPGTFLSVEVTTRFPEDDVPLHVLVWVLMMQADTFAGANETLDGFDEIVAQIGAEAASFAGPVLLLQGDTHSYLVDAPYAQAPNLTRIVVEGETAGEWLRLTLDPRSPQLFSWQRVTVGGGG